MVFPSPKYHEPLLAEVLVNQEITTRVLSKSSPFYIVTLPVLPSSHELSRRKILSFARHTNLCIHNSEDYMLFVLSLLNCFLTSIYQLIIKSMLASAHRCLLLLWSVKPFYSRMTRRNKLQYLVHIQDWVKVVVSHRSKCQPSFCSVLP